MRIQRLSVALTVAITLALSLTSLAAAEHPASHATFEAINRQLAPSAKTLGDHLKAVWVSSYGPYALAHETGGQAYRELFKRQGRKWRDLAVVSIATGYKCSLTSAKVRADLHILRYVAGHRCY